MLRKTAGAVVFVFVLAWVVQNPATAGDDVHTWVAAIFTAMRHLS